jgi:Tfp pilus assembly protein PilF
MQQAIDMDPSLPQNHARLGLVFKQKGMYEQAEVEIRKAETMEALPSRLGSLADLYCDWDLPPNNSPNNWNHAKTFPVGQDDLTCTRAPQAKAVLNTLIAMSKVRYVPPDLVAGIYARLGEQELALSWLERATADDRPRLDRKVFDRFRSDRRFRELQTRVGSTKLCW